MKITDITIQRGTWVMATSQTGHRYLGRLVEPIESVPPTIVLLEHVVEVVFVPTPTGGLREVPAAQSGAVYPQFVHAHDLVCIELGYARRMLDQAGRPMPEEKERQNAQREN